MRITARLDEKHIRQLEDIQRRSGKTRTQILKEALELYFRTVNAAQSTREKNRRILEQLAGIGEGPEDLSERYKEYLDRDWREKHDLG